MPPEKVVSQPGIPTENEVSNTNGPKDYLKCEDKKKRRTKIKVKRTRKLRVKRNQKKIKKKQRKTNEFD